MTENYVIVLFKNKVKKKIIKKFKTSQRANEFYNKLIKKSNEVIFEKKYEEGVKSKFEIAFLEKRTNGFTPFYVRDEIGRQVKIELENEDYVISKINEYRIPELILDYSINKKITIEEFIKKYLKKDSFKLISKLNNKIIVQNDDNYHLFTLKNNDDSSRFIDDLSKNFFTNKRNDCIFVKDYTTTQRKYLYSILEEKGFPREYLFRHSTSHVLKT